MILGVLGWVLVTLFWFFNLHEVVAGGVYRSAQPSGAFLETVVRRKGIRSVIKLNAEGESGWSRGEREAAQRLGVKFYAVPIGVTELPGRQDLLAMIDAIETAPRPVLVHCKSGADRTGVAAVLVAMRDGGKTLEEAENEQLGLKYLHVGHLGEEVKDVFGQYLEDTGRDLKGAGGWKEFREYALKEYWPGFFHARIEAMPARVEAKAGEEVRFGVKVTNASRRPWETDAGRPFALQLQQPGTRKKYYPEVLAEAALPRTLGAGESVTVEVPFTIPKLEPGEYRYTLDVAQKEGTTFNDRGSDVGEVTVVVK